MRIENRLLENHARRLADRFFREEDARLIRKLRELSMLDDRRQKLSVLSGITDVRVLDRLIELDIDAEVLASLALVPLLAVAWADGRISAQERSAVLETAEEWHLGTDPEHRLLDRWLSRPPDPQLLEAWVLYIQGLCQHMDADHRRAFRAELLEQARRVASDRRGLLGVVSPVSRAKQRVLESLDEAFAHTTCGDQAEAGAQPLKSAPPGHAA